jgi:hypothetical protein
MLELTYLCSLLSNIFIAFLNFLLIEFLQVFDFIFVGRLLLSLLYGVVFEGTELFNLLVKDSRPLLVLLHLRLVSVTILTHLSRLLPHLTVQTL